MCCMLWDPCRYFVASHKQYFPAEIINFIHHYLSWFTYKFAHLKRKLASLPFSYLAKRQRQHRNEWERLHRKLFDFISIYYFTMRLLTISTSLFMRVHTCKLSDWIFYATDLLAVINFDGIFRFVHNSQTKRCTTLRRRRKQTGAK